MRNEASYCVQETLEFNNEIMPRFASSPVLDRILASPRDLNGSDPNLFTLLESEKALYTLEMMILLAK